MARVLDADAAGSPGPQHGGEDGQGLDPATLRPLGRGLDVGFHVRGWSFSPDRSKLVLCDDGGTSLVVDPVHLRRLARIDLFASTVPDATYWLGGRPFAVIRASGGVVVRRIDLAHGRAYAHTRVRGSLVASARSRQGIVLLLAPVQAIGRASLVVVDAGLRVRRVTLSRIRAGLRIDRDDLGRPFEQRTPALAVDEAGGRAFVAGGGEPIAVVDLRSLRVAYRAPRGAAARDKGAPNGPRRYARWLGDGLLAVWGTDDHGARDDGTGRARSTSTAAGAIVVDTRGWTSRTIDADATEVTLTRHGLLTTAILWDSASDRTTGAGLSLYDVRGIQSLHLFGDDPIFDVAVVGDRAFVRRAGSAGYEIVDLAGRRIVRHVAGDPPTPLVPG